MLLQIVIAPSFEATVRTLKTLSVLVVYKTVVSETRFVGKGFSTSGFRADIFHHFVAVLAVGVYHSHMTFESVRGQELLVADWAGKVTYPFMNP
jgi:hypothetical protein